MNLTYGYDGVGNVTSIGDPRDGHTSWFEYDALDRLTSVNGYGATGYAYDALGNRTQAGGTSYGYDANTQRLTSSWGATTETFTYDPRGNLQTDNTGTYYYDRYNTLVLAILPSGWYQYEYDGDQQRVARWGPGGVVATIHNANGQLLSEFGAGGAWQRDMIYVGTELIASLRPAVATELTLTDLVGTWWIQGEDLVWRTASIADEGGNNVAITNEWNDVTHGTWDPVARTMTAGEEWSFLQNDVTANVNRLVWHNGSTWLRSPHPLPDEVLLEYFHVDALGSVRATTNLGGLETGRLDYLPFGEGPGTTGAGDKVRFAGEERDAESYLDYFGARYYRNVTGRFAAVDPVFSAGAVTRPQAWNRYAYALNGPLRFTDPTGREAEDKTGPRFLQSEAAPSVFSMEAFNAWAGGYVYENEYIAVAAWPLVNVSSVRSLIAVLGIEGMRDSLVASGKQIAAMVAAKVIDKQTGADRFFQNALARLRAGSSPGRGHIERALLLATGAAIELRGPVGDRIGIYGGDSLHHFFANAYNTVAFPLAAPLIAVGGSLLENEFNDVRANSGGVSFGLALSDYLAGSRRLPLPSHGWPPY